MNQKEVIQALLKNNEELCATIRAMVQGPLAHAQGASDLPEEARSAASAARRLAYLKAKHAEAQIRNDTQAAKDLHAKVEFYTRLKSELDGIEKMERDGGRVVPASHMHPEKP